MNRTKAEIDQMCSVNSTVQTYEDSHSKHKPTMVENNESRSALKKDEHIKVERRQQENAFMNVASCNKKVCLENSIKSSLKKKKKKLKSTNTTAKSKPKVKTIKESLSNNSVSSYDSETLNLTTEKEFLLSCRFCRKEFQTLEYFEDHDCECIKSKSTIKTLKCKYCSLNFSQKNHLNEHVKGHKRNNCTICNAHFNKRKALCKHLKTAHNAVVPEKIYSCSFCKEEFCKKQPFIAHLKIHANSQHFCIKCGFMCDNESKYNEHMKDHVKSSKFECKFCKQKFARRQQHDQHMMGHQRHSCSLCDLTFSTKKLLKKHTFSVHGKCDDVAKKHACPICEKRFSRPNQLQIHQGTHTGEKPVTCTHCVQSFPNTCALSKHMKSIKHLQCVSIKEGKVFEIEKRFQCDECGIKFYRRSCLFRHIELIHSESETFKCPHCEYSTKSKTNLKRHIECHTDNKPFICEVCGASFRALATLKSHHAYVHSESRSFVCETCNKSFKIKGSLLRHAKIHSQARPYKCRCRKTYKRLSHLKRHMASVHHMVYKKDEAPVTSESENLETDVIEINSDASVESLDALPDHPLPKNISLLTAPTSNICNQLEGAILNKHSVEFFPNESPKDEQYIDVPSNIVQTLIDKVDTHVMPHIDVKSTLVTLVSTSPTKTSPICVQTNHDSNSVSLDDPNLNLSPSNLCNFNFSSSPIVIENWVSALQDKMFSPDAFTLSSPESLIRPHSKFQNQNLDSSFSHFSIHNSEPQTSLQSFLLNDDISSPTHMTDLNLGQNASKNFFGDTDDILSHESGELNEVNSGPPEHIFSPSRSIEHMWDTIDNSNRVKLPSSELVSDTCGNTNFSTNLALTANNILSHNLMFSNESLIVSSLDVNNLNPDFDSLSNLC